MRILTKDIVNHVGKEVELKGWVATRRDHGKLIFIDLRDRSGIAQLVFLPNNKAVHAEASKLRPEWVICVKGTVAERPEAMRNKEIPTGNVEIQVNELEVLNQSETPPFPIETDGREIGEEVRLKYRYIDLRRDRLQKNLRLRSEFLKRVREFLFREDFTEIETPILTKSTPEGARDFIVPSRLYPGSFFALPQSPQQYKQLLMVGGFERYFQIARCLRDEDPRADRGYEFTQIDMEMSFVTREEVMRLNEEMMISVFEDMGYTLKQKPFPIFTYAEAMKQFGADKFDLRTEEDKKNGVLAFAWVVDFPFFEKDKNGKWTFTHNPFSAPKPEHKAWLLKGEQIPDILTSQYDLVCNGYEVGGGSIRAHEPEVLKAVFQVMGYEDDHIEKEFGHMLTAFKHGAPPHGGIAHGVERLIMIMRGEEYVREVQAFPQTGAGHTSIMDAPSTVTKAQLDEVGLEIKKSKSNRE